MSLIAVTRLPDGSIGYQGVRLGQSPVPYEIARVDHEPRDGEIWDDSEGRWREPNTDDLRERARADKLEALSALRKAVQYGEFLYDGAWYDCSELSQPNILGEAYAEREQELDPDPDWEKIPAWRDADNGWQPVLDARSLRKLAKAMRRHIQKCFKVFAVHEMGLRRTEDPAGYDITSGWPDTRADRGKF